jgi:hypothetical protein
MIWESSVWKEELARDLLAVKQQIDDAGSTTSYEQVAVVIEKFAFTSAFIIRKLSEANKLSDEVESTNLPVRRFPKTDSEVPIHLLNWHKFETFYDLDVAEKTNLSPRRLCNMLIHSFVFILEMDETGSKFERVLFNSDHIKDKHLYQISLDALFTFVETVSADHIDYLVCENLLDSDSTVIHKSQNAPSPNLE